MGAFVLNGHFVRGIREIPESVTKKKWFGDVEQGHHEKKKKLTSLE